MPLDTLDSPSNFTGRMAEASRRRNVYETTADQIERDRRARLSAASMQALMRRTDPYGDTDRLEDIGERNDEEYDLEYRMPRRSRLKGDITRDEGLRDAGAEQERYFTQEPMREDKQRRSMEALRQRYTDPAMIKAEADLRREALRGSTARDVEGLRGSSRERQSATNAYGDLAGDRVLGGDRAAGAPASEELRGRMGAAQRTVPIAGARGLQAFANANDMTLEEAIEYAESQGYTVTR
ncbi:MAG: hypothetical protein ACREK4_02935 [Candidatus Rokuibacteriota bacterium]